MFGLPVDTAFRAPTGEERDVIEAVVHAGSATLAPLLATLRDARVRRFDDDGCLEFEPGPPSAVRPPHDVPFFEIASTMPEAPWESGPGGLFAIYVLVDALGRLAEMQFNFGLSPGAKGGPTYGEIARFVRDRCGLIARRELP